MNTNNFTFFQTFIFTAPIAIDIAYFKTDLPIIKTAKWILFGFNIFVLCACILGFAGFIVDKSNYFSITTTAMYFPGKSIKKTSIGWYMFINILVPVLYMGFSSCQDGNWVTMMNKKGNRVHMTEREARS